MDARLDAFLKSASALSLQDRLARARAAAQTAVAARGDPREVYSASPMATDTDARSGDVPSTSAARAEADDALAASKRMHFTYARHYLPPSSPTVTDQPPSLASLGLTPLVDPRAVPDVLRAVLLEDGCVKVNFRDNTVLRLDPTGSAFTVTTPEGETLRQLSEFAVTRFARKLRSALEFRNAHADVPFLPPAIARLGVDEDDGVAPEGKKTDLRFRASARARYASWSLDAEDAERSGFLTRLEGGGAALESTEGIARVVLSAHGLVARVTYPLLFAVKDASETSAGPADSAESDAAAETDGTPSRRRLAHDYVWHTQTFCADACPARWQFPVALLTRAVYGEGGSDENANASTSTPAGPEGREDKRDDVTTQTQTRAGSVTTLPVSATALPRGFGLSHGLWVDEGDDNEKPWWSSPAVVGYPEPFSRGARVGVWNAKTSGRRPTVERAPGQTSFTVRSSEARSVTPIGTADIPTGPWVEVVSVLDADGDVLVSADAARFVVHIPDEPSGAAAAKMYAVDAVPARVAPAGRAGVAFQAAQAGGEFQASQGRAKGGDRGGDTDAGDDDGGVGPRAERVPLGRFAARVAALRAAAAAPVADPEAHIARKQTPGPSCSVADADGGVSFGRGATTDSDAAAWAEDPDPWSVLSAEVVEESAGEGSFASFVAYADGRVRVKFADRTLLELRRDRRAARLLLPDGERVEVRASAPMRWGKYVTAASEFGRWAFMTPEARERAAEEDRARDARVQAELDGIRRFAAIQTGQPPEDENKRDAAQEVAAKSVSVPSTPERGPRAQPSAPATPQSEAPVFVSASSRSPLREARRKGSLSVSVPASPLDGARIRRQESLEKMKREWEEDDAFSSNKTVSTRTKKRRGRARCSRMTAIPPTTATRAPARSRPWPPAFPLAWGSRSPSPPRWRRPRVGWRVSKTNSRRAARTAATPTS
jgi:hypothetical protein